MMHVSDDQYTLNTITSRQIFGDARDCFMIMGKSRARMLEEKHDALARKLNFYFFTEQPIVHPVRQISFRD